MRRQKQMVLPMLAIAIKTLMGLAFMNPIGTMIALDGGRMIVAIIVKTRLRTGMIGATNQRPVAMSKAKTNLGIGTTGAAS